MQEREVLCLTFVPVTYRSFSMLCLLWVGRSCLASRGQLQMWLNSRLPQKTSTGRSLLLLFSPLLLILATLALAIQ